MALGVPIAIRRRACRSWRLAWAFCLAAGWICVGSARGEAPSRPSEYDVKAAYLLNFGKFMRLNGGTQQHSGSFDICILGHDPMGTSMDQLATNEIINDRPVHIRRIQDPTQGRSCQVLYISPSETGRLREDLAILEGSDTLTVGESPDFLSLGGMIQFILQGDHVRFNVNLKAVNHTHIVLSSELLRVAASVEGSPNRGGTR